VALLKNKLVLILVAVLLLGGGGAYYFLVLHKKDVVAGVKKKGSHVGEEYEGGEVHASDGEHGDESEEEGLTSKNKHKADDEEEADDTEEEEASAGSYGSGHSESKSSMIEPFVVNLADPGSRRYLRVNLTLELKKPEEAEPLLEARMPQMRDTVLLLLSSKTTDQLLAPEGKITLRQELIEQINKVLKTKKLKRSVKNLYFTEFLIQ
jgi:flagellar FliL protein